MLDYDKILEHLGELGKWNWFLQLLIWMGPFVSGMTVLVYSFTGKWGNKILRQKSAANPNFFLSGLEPDRFRCLIPECDSNVTNPSFKDVALSVFPLDDDDEKDFCMYYMPRENATSETCHDPSVFDVDGRDVDCETESGNFLYDTFEMDSTIVTDWDLVCDDQFKVMAMRISKVPPVFFPS